MTARKAVVACALASTGAQGFLGGTGAPTPAPPAPSAPNTPAPTWSTDDPQAHYVGFEEHCHLNLNYDECLAFATAEGADFQSTTLENQGLPSGCFRQYPDAVFVYNQQPSFNFVQLSGSALCPNADVTSITTGETTYINCYLKMACREPDFDQLEEDEHCEDGQEMTQNECAAIGAVHAESGSYETESNSGSPSGCFINVDTHITYFNSHPVGGEDPSARALCSQDMGPTDAPTPEPTPMPTPAPTITPTWSEELETYMADWGHGCTLNLNKEECENWGSTKNAVFETRNEEGLPRGCWQQHPDEVVIFNAYSTWSSTDVALETWCDVDPNVDPEVMDKPCWARMVCRKADWYVQEGYCQAGTGVSQRECERIGAANDMYGGRYMTLRSSTDPVGCFGAKMNGEPMIMFNLHSSGGGRNRGLEAFCAKPAHQCAAKDDGLNRNKWCQKKCNKKRKKTCNARCDRRCLDTCKCNVKCADSETWYFHEFVTKSVMKEGWYNERNCAWVAEDVEGRCKLDGMDGDKKVRANSACPTACGKCGSERRLSSKVMIV